MSYIQMPGPGWTDPTPTASAVESFLKPRHGLHRGPHCHPGGVRAEGPADADIMIVSIGPGQAELTQDRPFIGESGKLLDACLNAVGIKRSSVYLTNICCDHLGEDNDDAERCWSRLASEIASVKPKVIIPLGAYATELLTATWLVTQMQSPLPQINSPYGYIHPPAGFLDKPGRTIGKVRGQPLWYDNVYGSGHSCRVMPTWQPAAFLREGGASYIIDITRDLMKLMPYPQVDVLSWSRDHGKFVWELLDTPDKAHHWLEWNLDRYKPVAIDIETGNSDQLEEMTMDVYSESMLCFAIAQSDPDTVINGKRIDGVTYSATFTPETYQTFVNWFNHQDMHSKTFGARTGDSYMWCMHYGYFDKAGIKRFLDLLLKISRDTLGGSYALDERQGVHKLKTNAREYTGADFWESFIEADLKTIRARDKFLARLKPQAEWPNPDMEQSDVELFYPYLDNADAENKPTGRVQQAKCSEGVWELWELFKKNWHHNITTMKKTPGLVDSYQAKLEAIDHYGFEMLDRYKLYVYNGEDAARTAQLEWVQEGLMKADGVWDLYNDLIVPDIDVNAEIGIGGIPVDIHVRDSLKAAWEPIRDRMQVELQQEAYDLGFRNPPTKEFPEGEPINLGSWKQKGRLFYDVMELDLPNVKGAVTKSGNKSTNIKVLEEMKDQTDFIPRMIAFSHANHQLKAYIEPIPRYMREGKIHPTWKPHGARTSRDSYADPPLHQIPHYVQFEADFEDEDPFHAGKDALREMFVSAVLADGTIKLTPDGTLVGPDKEEYVFAEVDYIRSEYYWMAYLSGDDALLADVAGGDLHENTAIRLYKIQPDQLETWRASEIHGKQRRDGKTINFGVSFGIQAPALSLQLKVPIHEAALLLTKWWGGYADLKRATDEWKREAMKTGEIVAPTGRKRRFRLILGEDSFHELNQAMNFKPQCMSTENMKQSRIELHRGTVNTPTLASLQSRILFSIHDMIAFAINVKHFQEVASLITEVMATPRWGFPGVPVDMKVGPNWGKTEDIIKDPATGLWSFAA